MLKKIIRWLEKERERERVIAYTQVAAQQRSQPSR